MSAPPAAPRAENRALNALRAVSAVLVVVYHARMLLFVDQADAGDGLLTRMLYAVTGLGPAAVLVFFVLSGYWVGGSVFAALRRDRFRWATYASARLTRLWVVLIPAIALTAALDLNGSTLLPGSSVYLGDPAYHDTVPAADLDRHLTPLAALGNLLFLQPHLAPTFGTNASLWSLSYEATYYALLPLALCAWRARRTSVRLANVGVALVICAIAGPAVLIYLPVWLLGAGVAAHRDRIAAWLERRPPAAVTAARAVAATGLAGALYATHLSYSNRNVGLLAVTTTALVALLVTDVRWTGAAGRALAATSAYAHSSYSLYAVHLPIVALFTALVVPQAAHRWTFTPGSLGVLAALVGGLMVVGWVFAHLTERHTDRLRAAVDRWWRRPAPARPVGSHRIAQADRPVTDRAR